MAEIREMVRKWLQLPTAQGIAGAIDKCQRTDQATLVKIEKATSIDLQMKFQHVYAERDRLDVRCDALGRAFDELRAAKNLEIDKLRQEIAIVARLEALVKAKRGNSAAGRQNP